MAIPTISSYINDGRGAIRHGLNTARFYAASAATDNFAATTLLDLSSLFLSAPYPLGVKIHKIYGGVDGTMTGLQFLFDKVTDETIYYATSPNENFEQHFKHGLKSTSSELLDACGTSWTAAADVTQADETTIVVDSGTSQKFTIDAAFTTGIVGYCSDYSAINISDYDGVSFFIYSSIDLNPGDLQFCIDEHSAIASPSETLTVPIAIKAGSWNRIELPFVAASTTRDAIICHGLKATRDFGAGIIYIDSIRYKKLSTTFPSLSSGRKTVGAIDDVVITSTGIANGDKIFIGLDFECVWSQDNIK